MKINLFLFWYYHLRKELKMDNIKQYIIDFIKGKADAEKFINDCETDPSIFD